MVGDGMLKVLLIGYGAVGAYVFERLAEEQQINVKQVLCRPGRKEAAWGVLGRDVEIISDLDQMADDITLVLECAGHNALARYGAELLAASVDVFTVSNGALADVVLYDQLQSAARAGGSKLRYLSGAIGAIDALAAAALGGLREVTYIGRKTPLAWKGSPAEKTLDLECLEKAACHFRGSARQAALHYPKNANVAATVALAGIGLDETNVKLIADPDISGNIHEIVAIGAFGKMKFFIEGQSLPGNPKSSALTAMSVVRAVRDQVAAICC
jgi:aspartate dehydrogenase